MRAKHVHRAATTVLSLVMMAIGVALAVEAIAGASGGAVTVRLLLGVLFAAAGAGRLYVQARRGSGA